MGIQGLSKVIADYAPSGMKETELSHYFGRKIAVDASMCLYQFLTAVRIEGLELQSEDGETTSHLMGLFYSTIRLMENGIKPVYVFDGVPPDLKSGELQKRKEKREKNKELLKKAEESGDTEGIEKFSKRMVRVTGAIVDEAKELLTLMGVPTFEAPGEAEAQCAEMVRSGKVYACASEDMDSLTFGANILLRHVTVSAAKKLPILEYNLDKILAELQFTRDEFIDFSILLGCDYCESIRGAGMVRSFQLIKTHRNIEKILENIDKTKYTAPENWIYKEARVLFQEPDVANTKDLQITWNAPDEEGLVKFLCGKRNFNEARVRNGVKKLIKARGTATQGRLDSFFTVSSTNSIKRKAEEKPVGNKKAKKAPAGKFKGRGK